MLTNKIYKNTTFLLFCFIFMFLTIFILNVMYKNNILSTMNDVKENMTVIIDAGHGGFDGGASNDDILEKDINLNISLMTADILKVFGYDVILTRNSDTSTAPSDYKNMSKKTADIKQRLKIIEETNNCIALSIHQNHYSSEYVHGAQIFYGTKNELSKNIAQTLQEQIKTIDPTNNRKIKPITKDVYLVHNSTKPIVLIECGFLSNELETKKLNSYEYQQNLAYWIASSILLMENNKQ